MFLYELKLRTPGASLAKFFIGVGCSDIVYRRDAGLFLCSSMQSFLASSSCSSPNAFSFEKLEEESGLKNLKRIEKRLKIRRKN